MPRSRIEVGGDIDTWIRELPNLGRSSGDVRVDWAEAMHLMLLASREHTHVITGQLRGTQYSTTQARGSWQVEGRILYPARNPRDGYHYGYYEFKKRDSSHDAPRKAFAETREVFIEAIGAGLERQVRVVVMELGPAMVRELKRRDPIAGYVQDRVWKYKLDQHVDQKGTRAVVVIPGDGWAQPNRVNTQEFPLLSVERWVDCSRVDDGHGRLDKAAGDAIDNAWALYRVVDRELHPPGGIRGQRWGSMGSDPGLLVIGCQRWAEPDWYDADKPDGSGRKFGEAAMVRVQYALQLSHGRD